MEPVLKYSSTHGVGYGNAPPDWWAYISIFRALSNLLSGSLGTEDRTGSISGADALLAATAIVACPETSALQHLLASISPEMCRNRSLATAIEDLSHNFTLSLLSSATFSTTRLANVSMFFPLNYYVYHPRNLALSYLLGLGVSFACFLIGAWACKLNGHSASASFSTIMQTTRNSQLDELIRMGEEGYQERRDALRTVKLQYGIVGQGGDMGHVAFGRADTITRVAKL